MLSFQHNASYIKSYNAGLNKFVPLMWTWTVMIIIRFPIRKQRKS